MLAQTQREHIDRVLSVADIPPAAGDPIQRSWSRCLKDYGLDPARATPAQIIEHGELRLHQERMDAFLRIARTGMEQLYRRVVDQGYVVLLTNAQGITVDFVGDLSNPNLKRSGLYIAADWGEGHAGTCGVGTCIVERAPITCHQTDHFDCTHLPLTCSSAPIYDPYGGFLGVLDISALSSPAPHESQHLALQMATLYAELIENANFFEVFRDRWVLRMSSAWSMVDVAAEMMFAFDDAGIVVGANSGARRALRGGWPPFGNGEAADTVGRAIGGLFREGMDGIWRLASPRLSTDRGVLHTAAGATLFGSVTAPRTPARRRMRPSPSPGSALDAVAGSDPVMEGLVERARRVVDRPINILLLGETGTGKEVFARAIHAAGSRAGRPLVAVNCAALPEPLIESELFGYAAGSFTGGRHKGKRGLIVEANGGTLFLDEIGDMPIELQTRLLRVLSANEVLVLGETRPTPVDIRFIAASNQDLRQLIAKGRFREDLYYRLCGLSLHLPALRNRTDRADLIEAILDEEARQIGVSTSMTPAAAAALDAYRWPGNIRQLRSVLRLLVALSGTKPIDVEDIPDEVRRAPNEENVARCNGALSVLDALECSKWSVPGACMLLGVSRATLYRRMKQQGIQIKGRPV